MRWITTFKENNHSFSLISAPFLGSGFHQFVVRSFRSKVRVQLRQPALPRLEKPCSQPLINKTACVCSASSVRKPPFQPPPAHPGPGRRQGGWRRAGPRSCLHPGPPLQCAEHAQNYISSHLKALQSIMMAALSWRWHREIFFTLKQVDVVNSGDGDLLLLFLRIPLHCQLVQLQGDDVMVIYNSMDVSMDHVNASLWTCRSWKLTNVSYLTDHRWQMRLQRSILSVNAVPWCQCILSILAARPPSPSAA